VILAQLGRDKLTRNTWPILAQVLILVFAIVFTSVTVFPYNGGDTWAHIANAERFIAYGGVQGITDAYHDYPLYPAFLALLSWFSGGEIADAARLANVLVATLCIVLSYSLARVFYSVRQSLILSLVLLGSKWFIYWMTFVVSMPVAVLLYWVLAVILFRRLRTKAEASDAFVLLLVTGVISFFHPVGSVAAIVLLLGFWFLEHVNPDRGRSQSKRYILNSVLFAVVVTSAQWMYYGDFIFDRTIRNLANAILYDSNPIRLAISYRDPFVYTLDQLNFYLLLSLAGLGILRQIQLKKDTFSLYAGLLGLVFVVIGHSTQIVNLQAALPYRWLSFGTLLLVFPASSICMQLLQHNNGWRRGIAMCLLIAYFFAGLINSEINRDHPLYGEGVTQLTELTSSEYAGLLALERVSSGDVPVRVDYRLWDYLKSTPMAGKATYWTAISLEGYEGIFAFRKVYFTRQSFIQDSATRVDLHQPGLSQIYDSGDMQILDYTGSTNRDR